MARRSTGVLALGTILFIPRKPCFAGSSVCGARDARADLAHGRYVLTDYGFPFGVLPETDKCLRQHGLEVRVVGLDIMNDSERSYYLSYISVMNPAIAHKFSPGVFEECCRYQPISLTIRPLVKWEGVEVKSLLKEGVEPVLVDVVLSGKFEPKAEAATAGR